MEPVDGEQEGGMMELVTGVSDCEPASPEVMAEVEAIAKRNQAALDEMMERDFDPRRCYVIDLRQRHRKPRERRPQ